MVGAERKVDRCGLSLDRIRRWRNRFGRRIRTRLQSSGVQRGDAQKGGLSCLKLWQYWCSLH